MIRIVKIHFVTEMAVAFYVDTTICMVRSAKNIVYLLSHNVQHATGKTVVYLRAHDAIWDIM